MKLLSRVLFLTMVIALASGCGSARGPINWPGLVKCAPGISDLIASVSRVLIGDGPQDQTSISGRGKNELEDLARVHGPGTVACVVERLVNDWTGAGAAQEPLRLAAAARGQDFLTKVGTDAQLSPDVE